MSDYSDSIGTLLSDFWITNREIRDEQVESFEIITNIRPNYDEYIKSPEWKQTAKELKEKAGWRCQLCNKPGNGKTLNAHHRTYSTLGNEDNDIIVLCVKCHEEHHNKLYKFTTDGKLHHV